ncbi:hypothetical protein UP06_01480 [Bradyrhizobium sp. LTSP857]|nr:hypothetical protein UP06_01480 [Bradyrhizobium sp. LTSP857]
MLGGLSFGLVTVLRSLKVKSARGTTKSETKSLFVTYVVFFFASVFLFIGELIAVATRLAHL